MFIYNIKLRKAKLKNIVFTCFSVFLLILLISFISKKIFTKTYVKDTVAQTNILELTPNNYCTILKLSHENLDMYVGKKIKFSGFVYRLYDFQDDQFVLGRQMLIGEPVGTQAQAVTVGFLCTYNKAKLIPDSTWVEIEGTIEKGYYHSEIPIIKIKTIHQIECPKDEYVCPPDNTYLKTEEL